MFPFFEQVKYFVRKAIIKIY